MVAAEAKKVENQQLVARLREAAALPDETWVGARRLAGQLDGKPVLPLIGAGASVDCEQKLAGDVSKEMYDQFMGESSSTPSDLGKYERDLGVVADAIYVAGGQERVVDALDLKNESKWPDMVSFDPHFCSYRFLARLAREGFVSEAISLNYDCGFERGLADEGFQFEPWLFRGKSWPDHATVVTGGANHVSLEQRGEMVLTKAHGCAAAYRREGKENGSGARDPSDSIVVRRGQLLDWRTDLWARDLFADRVRRHVVLLLGTAGQDPVIHIALTRVLEEVYEHLGDSPGTTCAEPRVVVVDRSPDTVALRSLVHQGCGRRAADPNVVTTLTVPDSTTMTAVVVAIATEMLALRLLRDEGLSVGDPVQRVISLMVAAPASLRWAFHLERRTHGNEYLQRVSLEKAKGKGYVPLSAGSARVAESLRVRTWLRSWLGLPSGETIEESVDGHGFVISAGRGQAFLPLGITGGELRSLTRADLRLPTTCFPAPAELDLVLVARDGRDFIGRSVGTGRERRLV